MRKRMVVFLFVVALVGTVIFGWMTIRRGVKRAAATTTNWCTRRQVEPAPAP